MERITVTGHRDPVHERRKRENSRQPRISDELARAALGAIQIALMTLGLLYLAEILLY